MSAMLDVKTVRGFLAVLCVSLGAGAACIFALIILAALFLTGSSGTPVV